MDTSTFICSKIARINDPSQGESHPRLREQAPLPDAQRYPHTHKR